MNVGQPAGESLDRKRCAKHWRGGYGSTGDSGTCNNGGSNTRRDGRDGWRGIDVAVRAHEPALNQLLSRRGRYLLPAGASICADLQVEDAGSNYWLDCCHRPLIRLILRHQRQRAANAADIDNLRVGAGKLDLRTKRQAVQQRLPACAIVGTFDELLAEAEAGQN